MYYLAVAVDTIHALAMVIWILGLPLLFWHKYKKLSFAYCIFSIFFIIVNLTSQYFLGHCVLTSIAGFFWERSSSHVDTTEWFVTRFTRLIFNMTPTHILIKRLTEIIIMISSIGVLLFLFKSSFNKEVKSWTDPT